MKDGNPRHKRRVILVTDGDKVAKETVETAAHNIGGRCISASAGNPTPISGQAIIELVKKAKYDPVIVMFDDKGSCYEGEGETALKYVATHPDVEVIGVLAVASNTDAVAGTKVDFSITKDSKVIQGEVDKRGQTKSVTSVIKGDTVDILNELKDRVPFVIGVGDIGKMDGEDDPMYGAPITTKAFQVILDHWNSEAGGIRV